MGVVRQFFHLRCPSNPMNELRAAIRDRDPIAGSWVSIGHPIVAELSASLGFEFVLIDTEHAAIGIETLENLIRAVDAAPGETQPVVRVPTADPDHIKRVLDLGVSGIMVPQVHTRPAARKIVAATRYPPAGRRGVAASRAAGYGLSFTEYIGRADEETLVLVQIESSKGVANAGEIAAVEGIDGLYVGPADLSKSLRSFMELEGSDFEEATARVLEAAHAEETGVGIFVSAEQQIPPWFEAGFDFFTLSLDTQFIIDGNRRFRERFEEVIRDE